MIYNQGFGGGMKPKIIVTAPTGTVVTATKGTTVITASESGGKYVILADDYGVWTVAGMKGSQSASQDVNVVAVDTYEVTLDFTPKVLNDATWGQIRDVADASTGPNYWSVGDTKQITINGKLSDGLTLSNYSTWVYIIGFDHNKDVEGTGIAFQGFKTAQTGGIDVALCDSAYPNNKTSGQWFNMNSNNRNSGGWGSCNMRNNTLPVVKNALSPELISVIKTTSIYSDNTGGGSDVASYVTATQDELYLLAEFEIFGTRRYANGAEQNYQKQYSYYAAGNSKIKYKHDSPTNAAFWWERSVAVSDVYYFGYLTGNGTANSGSAATSSGLAPAFKVGSNPPPQPISALAVGSSVFCNVNGVKTEFIVVNQGKPSDIYDDSCDGTWLLMKSCYDRHAWDNNNVNNYKTSLIPSYLNDTFLNLLDIKNVVRQVKIPYVNGTGGSPVASGVDGLLSKVFLLSGREIGLGGLRYMPSDGSKLDYFDSTTGTDSKRVAYLTDGTSIGWWTRSPYTDHSITTWLVNAYGQGENSYTVNPGGVRPSFILPFDTQVDFQGNIVI